MEKQRQEQLERIAAEAKQKAQEEEESEEDEEESSEPEQIIIQKKTQKQDKLDFAKKGQKATAAQKKEIKEQMTIASNQYQKVKVQTTEGLIPADEAEGLKPKDGHKFQKRLGKKKTIKDNGGDWEVVDKREQYLVERPIESDSDAGSELSYD